MRQVSAAAAIGTLLSTLPIPAQVRVSRELQHDISPPMRSIASAAGAKVVRLADDPVVQRTAGTKLLATLGMNLLGLGSGFIGPQGTFHFFLCAPRSECCRRRYPSGGNRESLVGCV